MHTKWEYALNNWLAFVDPTETECQHPRQRRLTDASPFRTSLCTTSKVPHCHWLHEDWSILLLGTTVIREDFLTFGLMTHRAINDCPDRFVIIAVDRFIIAAGSDAMPWVSKCMAQKNKAFGLVPLRMVNSTLPHV